MIDAAAFRGIGHDAPDCQWGLSERRCAFDQRFLTITLPTE